MGETRRMATRDDWRFVTREEKRPLRTIHDSRRFHFHVVVFASWWRREKKTDASHRAVSHVFLLQGVRLAPRRENVFFRPESSLPTCTLCHVTQCSMPLYLRWGYARTRSTDRRGARRPAFKPPTRPDKAMGASPPARARRPAPTAASRTHLARSRDALPGAEIPLRHRD